MTSRVTGRERTWAAALWIVAILAGCGGESSDPSTTTGGTTASGGVTAGDASTGSASAGGVAAGGSDSGGTGVGDPPPECMAPCIWALVSPCRPPGTCTVETSDTAVVGCSPDSDWGYVYDVAAGTVEFAGPDGNLCYTIVQEENASIYRDAAGNLVASLEHVDPEAGTYSTTCADGSPTVVSGLDDPACAAWDLDCAEGACE